MSKKDNSINYIELPMDNNAEKKFYKQVFEWGFTAFPVQKLMEVLMGRLRYQVLEF